MIIGWCLSATLEIETSTTALVVAVVAKTKEQQSAPAHQTPANARDLGLFDQKQDAASHTRRADQKSQHRVEIFLIERTAVVFLTVGSVLKIAVGKGYPSDYAANCGQTPKTRIGGSRGPRSRDEKNQAEGNARNVVNEVTHLKGQTAMTRVRL